MKKIQNKEGYIYTLILIITPVTIMLSNLIGNHSELIWFLPILISFIIGLKFSILNFQKKENPLLSILIIIALISCLQSYDKYDAFLGSNYRLEGLVTYIGYIGFFVIGKELKDNITNNKIIKIFLITATIISIISLIRIDITYKLQDIPKDIHYYFYQGPFDHFNHFAYYLLIASICSTLMYVYSNNLSKKIFYLILNTLLLYTLVINDTFGVYIAYLITIICLFIYHTIKKKHIKQMCIIVLSFTIISIIAYRYDYNIHIVSRNFKELLCDTKEIVKHDNIENLYEIGTSRGKLWSYSIKYILKKPLFGYGYDNIRYEFHKDNILESRPHNLILEQATNIGIPGMFIYIFLILSIIIKKIKNINQISNQQLIALSVVIAYLISSMFGNSTFYVSPYFYIFLGILSQQEVKHENIKTEY